MAMIASWIQSIFDAVAWLAIRLNLFGFLRDLESCEPRAWLLVMTVFLAVWAVLSFLSLTRQRMACTRRRLRRSGSAWERLDGE